MKLAIRIISISFVTVMLLFGTAAYFRIRTAYDDFEARHRLVAERVAAAMDEPMLEAWRIDGLAGVNRLLSEESATRRVGLQLRWVWFDDQTRVENRPHLPVDRWPKGHNALSVSTITTDENGQRKMHTYVSVELVPTRAGGLELTGSMEPLDRLTWRRLQIDLAALVVLAAVSAGIAYWAGIVWISHPLRALVVKTQRIGRGDFSEPLHLKRNDELAELATAINDMCRQLEEYEAAIRDQTERRLATLEQLRHADRLKTVGRLAAGIAHELGTPLNVVAGRAALIAAGKLGAEEVKTMAFVGLLPGAVGSLRFHVVCDSPFPPLSCQLDDLSAQFPYRASQFHDIESCYGPQPLHLYLLQTPQQELAYSHHRLDDCKCRFGNSRSFLVTLTSGFVGHPCSSPFPCFLVLIPREHFPDADQTFL